MKPINTPIWSTPLIIGCAAVVAGSGVLLFFHLQEGLVKSMHEWLGMLFVAAIALHMLNHWRPFTRYFQDKLAITILVGVVALAGGWVLINGNPGEHPAKRLVGKVQNAPLVALAALQNEPGTTLQRRLQAAGIQVDSPQQTLGDIARSNRRSPLELLDLAMDSAAAQPAAGE